MSLATGSRLGPYEILAPLGAGGMGEVYRAKDARLGREVAIKVLPDDLVHDADRLRRFELEARSASALNHPNILTVFDVGRDGGRSYLVTELLDGEPLRELLARQGALAPRRALVLAAQVARGLAAAHDKGIVHRDLKPENLFVTADGRVKILDFGLARVAAAGDPSDARFAIAPTVAAATEPGTVLGTPGYMAPEQARGEPADARADLFALGCVLFEAAAGRAAFRRPTAAETMGALLRDEPDWTALPAEPAGLRRLLEHLLAKAPHERRRDAADVAIELDDLAAELGSATRPPSAERERTASHRLLPILAAAATLAVAGMVLVRFRATPAPSPPGARPAFELVPITFDEAVEEWPAFSPDGNRIAFVREQAGLRQLFVREVESGAERQLTRGEYDHLQPAFLPDGRSLVFVRARAPRSRLEPDHPFGIYGYTAASGGDVWRLEIASGRELLLVEQAFHPDPSPDGARLVVEADWSGTRRLWLVDARGANREQLTTDTSEAVSHIAPRFSPDGQWVAFQLREWTTTDIRAIEITTRQQLAITHDSEPDYYPGWAPDGRAILFSSYRSGGINLWRAPLAPDGTAEGRPEQLTQGAGQDIHLAAGPAGSGIAFSIQRQNASLWRLPLDPASGRAAGAAEPFVVSSREDSRGAWSPDGRTIAFNSDRDGEMNLWLFEVESRTARRLTSGAGGDYQPDWSPDGETLAFFSARAGSPDLWTVAVATGELRRLTDDSGIEINPFSSPDGRWLSYQSDATGRFEVWLLDLASGAQRQLSEQGVSGHYQRWSRDGRSLYFRCQCGGDRRVQLVSVADGVAVDLARVGAGGHISLLPGERFVVDTPDHRQLWRYPLAEGDPELILEFDDPAVRIDYPVVSPDGRWVIFDRLNPQGGDIWRLRPAQP